MNRLMATKKFRKKADLVASVRALYHTFLKLGNVLGMFGSEPKQWLEQQNLAGLADLGMEVTQVEAAIAQRLQARQDKDFGRSDEIRDELAEKGVLLLDGAAGTVWKIK